MGPRSRGYHHRDVVPYLVVFAASFAATFVTTPAIRKLSLRLGWIDPPSDRKVHPKPTPTAGGIAIFVGLAVGLGLSRVLPFLSGLHETTSDPDAAIVAGLVILGVGLLDDTRGVSVLGKLAGQILGAGMVAIAAVAFFVYMYRTGGGAEPSTAALISAVVAGSALGFLPWNFHPAKIFMGDSGAMLLGLMLGVATISGVGRNANGPSRGDLAALAIPIAVPLLVLAVPFLDVLLAIIRRMRKGLGITHADKQHIHHRLLDIGHSNREAVVLMYIWSALISMCALAVAFINGRLVVGGIVIVAVTAAAVLPRLIRDRAPRGSDPRRLARRNGRAARKAGRHATARAVGAGKAPEAERRR